MNAVQVEQKSYEMPPREGMSIAHFLTVADLDRSARYYEKVFGARILSRIGRVIMISYISGARHVSPKTQEQCMARCRLDLEKRLRSSPFGASAVVRRIGDERRRFSIKEPRPWWHFSWVWG